MSLPSFTNISLDRCIFHRDQHVKYLLSRSGFQWVGNNSFLSVKFSPLSFLVSNILLLTRFNYFLKLSLFPRDRSDTSLAA
jgi:hypothetical protein